MFGRRRQVSGQPQDTRPSQERSVEETTISAVQSLATEEGLVTHKTREQKKPTRKEWSQLEVLEISVGR